MRKPMNGSNDGFQTGVQPLPDVSESQQLAIQALLTGASDTDAAVAAGTNRITVHRWRVNDPAFAASLNLARKAVWDESLDALRAAVGEAIGVLLQDLRADDMTVRRQAARDVLKLAGVPSLQPNGPVTQKQQSMAWDSERKVTSIDLTLADF